jgi:TRAP-type mannitol/chloroaromatic compound transport system permease small subunit
LPCRAGLRYGLRHSHAIGHRLTLLLHLSRLVDAMNARIGQVCALLTLAACFICAGNAIFRYVVGWGSNALIELQWYLFGAIFLLGAGYALLFNEHVRVDIAYGAMSERGRLWVDLLGGIFFLVPFCVLMIWLGADFFDASLVSGERSNDTGGLLRWPAKLLIPVGFSLLLLQALSEIVKRIAALAGELRVDTSYEKPLQ